MRKREESILQMKRKYVLGIDPSGAFNEGKGTTGMCLLSKTKRYRLDNVWEIKAKDFASAEQYWYEHIRRIEQLHKRYPNLVVSIEDYILYAQKAQEQIHSHFETSQLIGVIRVYCWLHEIPLYIRPAVRVKNRWSDEILVHKGLIDYDEVKHCHTCAVKEGALSPHIKDSIRHAVHCMAFELRKEDDDGRRRTNKK